MGRVLNFRGIKRISVCRQRKNVNAVFFRRVKVVFHSRLFVVITLFPLESCPVVSLADMVNSCVFDDIRSVVTLSAPVKMRTNADLRIVTLIIRSGANRKFVRITSYIVSAVVGKINVKRVNAVIFHADGNVNVLFSVCRKAQNIGFRKNNAPVNARCFVFHIDVRINRKFVFKRYVKFPPVAVEKYISGAFCCCRNGNGTALVRNFNRNV